jgi:hypothetical protein
MAVMGLSKVAGGSAAGKRLAAGDVLEIGLGPASVRRLAGDFRGLQIRCTGAALWITQDGDLEDYFLVAGEQFTVSRPGPVVLQGMSGR